MESTPRFWNPFFRSLVQIPTKDSLCVFCLDSIPKFFSLSFLEFDTMQKTQNVLANVFWFSNFSRNTRFYRSANTLLLIPIPLSYNPWVLSTLWRSPMVLSGCTLHIFHIFAACAVVFGLPDPWPLDPLSLPIDLGWLPYLTLRTICYRLCLL